jgi:hypothetical protein
LPAKGPAANSAGEFLTDLPQTDLERSPDPVRHQNRGTPSEYLECSQVNGPFSLAPQGLGHARKSGVKFKQGRIDAYDPVNKNFTSDTYQSDGSRFSETFRAIQNRSCAY